MSRRDFPDVPGGYPFPKLELEVLERWRREEVFRRSLERPAPQGDFVFYEGPPTANNVPHVGHVVTRVVKDLFPRFRTMRGYRVRRQAGWDTHGLAVEIEVEKRLGFSGKRQIEEYGVAAFNRACLESVHTYERQWRAMSERVGYWLDFDHAYWTYHNDYIESVWWALARLYDAGLLYEGFKVQWYCGRCGTGLSSHEVAQNYKEADDPSIWTRFRVRRGQRLRTAEGGELAVEGRLDLVAWTTTPWTTLANVALAAHPDFTYVAVAHPLEPETLLLFAEGLATPVPLAVEEEGKRRLLDLRKLPPVARFRGRDLEGVLYERLYTFAEPELPGRVVLADYVTLSEGTGLVHTAPPFGEDDYETSRRYGLPLIFSIDDEGKVKPGFGPWSGRWFKDADAEILRDLRQRGLLLHAERYRHNYPFCWRCDHPLLSFARASWFVRTTAERDKLVAYNRERIAWHPPHIGEGRFGNWLENVVDWALSRKRYWGTPLPVWKCDLCPAVEVVGSYDQLFELAGRTPPADLYDRAQFDPHRPFIDEVTWPCFACREGGREGVFRRVDDVIDAWFDAGSMPFAQHHYMGSALPGFDPRGELRPDGEPTGFPAHFIAEGIDQTRGWFYTLHVLAVLLFDSVAYRDCIVTGHINDEQGRKMSKRLGNFLEPMGVIAEAGADAMRWYFCVNNPELTSRFSARLVREAAQGFLLPLWNALSFFTIYANLDGWHPGRAARVPLAERSELDRWILLRLDELVEKVTELLDAYEITEPARRLDRFVDDLTNWYIRRSRARFWAGNPESADKEAAYQTLHEVLATLAGLLAPFTPFLAEVLHGHLVRSQRDDAPASVHLEDWPVPGGREEELGREALPLVQGMSLVQRVVGLGRAARNTHSLKTRQPLAGVTIVARFEEAVRPYLERFGDLVKEELNVKEIRWAYGRSDFVHHEVHPNFRLLGKKLGPLMPKVKAALERADGDRLAEELEQNGAVELGVDGNLVRLERDELEVRLVEKEGLATAGDRELLVALDTTLTPELISEGLAREFVHNVQAARKEQGLDYADRIRIRYSPDLEEAAAIQEHEEWIKGETLAIDISKLESAVSETGGLMIEKVYGRSMAGIFKAYDVRGVYPTEVNEEEARKIGLAFQHLLDADDRAQGNTVVVSRDMREHSPSLAAALVDGLTAAGLDVLDIGLATTPMNYFAVGHTKAAGGIQVTASHNPARYNGFKLSRHGARPVSGDHGIPLMERKIAEGDLPRAERPGQVRPGEVFDDYRRHVLSFLRDHDPGGRRLRVAVDAANGMGTLYRPILEATGIDLVPLYFELDGRFPNHEANPLKEENLHDVEAAVRAHGADLGVAFDGDADRAAFIDESGEPIGSDLMTALIAGELLARAPGSAVLYDLRSSRAVAESIRERGGVPVRERVGHSFMKATLRERGAIFGGELAGHYYFRAHYCADSAILAMIEVLNLLRESGKPLSALVAPLRRYAKSPEINFVVEDKQGAMRKLAERYADAEIDYLDGITIQYPTWWANVRPSNTEPYLRLVLEATTPEELAQRRREITELLGEPEA